MIGSDGRGVPRKKLEDNCGRFTVQLVAFCWRTTFRNVRFPNGIKVYVVPIFWTFWLQCKHNELLCPLTAQMSFLWSSTSAFLPLCLCPGRKAAAIKIQGNLPFLERAIAGGRNRNVFLYTVHRAQLDGLVRFFYFRLLLIFINDKQIASIMHES